MTLDYLAAQAVHRARTLEKAVNDPGPWSISYGSYDAPACRWLKSDQVVFVAHFPDACWVDQDQSLVLRCRGEVVSSRPIDTPEDGEFSATWEIAMPTPVRA